MKVILFSILILVALLVGGIVLLVMIINYLGSKY